MLKKVKPDAPTSDPKETLSTEILYRRPTDVKHRYNRLVHISEALEDFLRNNTGPAKRRLKK